MSKTLLEVKGLSKSYVVKQSLFKPKQIIHAVQNVSFEIGQGEILGLIGESGSGKTTTGSLVLRLLKQDQGKIIFNGTDISILDQTALRRLRKEMQVVFQLSQESLDPKMTIAELIVEPLMLHKIVPSAEFDREVTRLLGLVGLGAQEKLKFPYQLSGGQKQRVGIARALASRPAFLVCDEPVSALDVSIQGQILNLLLDLRKELNLTYLFITHDLKVVKHICQRTAVMYKGEIVEQGNTMELLNHPRAPYTQQLVASIL